MGSSITIALWLVALLWAVQAVRAAYGVHRLPRLPRDVRPDGAASVAIIIPARDEAATIEHTARLALAQQDVDVRVVVVDDRSQDPAAAALQGLADSDPRLEVKRVDVLPDGWLGKTNALRVGAADVDAAWLLFIDADTALKPHAAARAIGAAQRAGAAHVALAPFLPARSLAARAALSAFFLGVVDRLGAVNADRPRTYFGIGAFNLVRTDVYRRFGGHEPLRMEVVDDVKLGLLVRRAGERSRVLLAPDAVRADWGATVGSLVKVVEKNHFAVLGYRVWLTTLVTAVLVAMWAAPLAGATWFVGAGSIAGLAAFLAMAANGLPGAIVSRRLGWGAVSGLISPWLLPILIYAALNSMLATLRRGGVRWRDTFYPLARLRREAVR